MRRAMMLLQAYSSGVFVASIEQIQKDADAIVLHLPLTDATHHLVDDAFLAACARKPILINVSRGGLVDNDALLRALDRGLVSGAALDVVEGEPSPPNAVVGRTDIIVTPHIAFSSDASLEELRRRCTEDVVRVLRGETPLHPCNAPNTR
jgi:phosphoglycerate dehydrogenase-like enzyme